jgi:hypothetical protein
LAELAQDISVLDGSFALVEGTLLMMRPPAA